MEVACVLIPDSALADPVEAGELTEELLRRLERIGAAVESERAGEAFFALDGLRGIHPHGELPEQIELPEKSCGRSAPKGFPVLRSPSPRLASASQGDRLSDAGAKLSGSVIGPATDRCPRDGPRRSLATAASAQLARRLEQGSRSLLRRGLGADRDR